MLMCTYEKWQAQYLIKRIRKKENKTLFVGNLLTHFLIRLNGETFSMLFLGSYLKIMASSIARITFLFSFVILRFGALKKKDNLRSFVGELYVQSRIITKLLLGNFYPEYFLIKVFLLRKTKIGDKWKKWVFGAFRSPFTIS